MTIYHDRDSYLKNRQTRERETKKAQVLTDFARVSHGLREAKRNRAMINGREEPISGTAHWPILLLVSLAS